MIITVEKDKSVQHQPYFIWSGERGVFKRIEEFPAFYADVAFMLLPEDHRLIGLLKYPLKFISRRALLEEINRRGLDFKEHRPSSRLRGPATGISFTINAPSDLEWFVMLEDTYGDEHLVVRVSNMNIDELADPPQGASWEKQLFEQVDQFYAIILFFADQIQVEILSKEISFQSVVGALEDHAKAYNASVEVWS